jgi:hypothetical protein
VRHVPLLPCTACKHKLVDGNAWCAADHLSSRSSPSAHWAAIRQCYCCCSA